MNNIEIEELNNKKYTNKKRKMAWFRVYGQFWSGKKFSIIFPYSNQFPDNIKSLNSKGSVNFI